MQMSWPQQKKIESYSSYKKRFFNKYKDRIKSLKTGINDLSLKPKDKELLKKDLVKILDS
jgi:beta-glucosidase/6-phospho-beta-glucosidase/beta-galactosidase